MEGAEKGEKSGKESLSLRVDPKWCVRYATLIASLTLDKRSHQEALGAFFPLVKTGDPRADFYTIYERKADEHDADYVKKCNEDLNTTLIFVRCSLSALALVDYLTCSRRRVCFLSSAQLSSQMYIRTSKTTNT